MAATIEEVQQIMRELGVKFSTLHEWFAARIAVR